MLDAKAKTLYQEFAKGIFELNPIFVLVVGLCPTMAVTTGLKNAAAMGAAVIVVLTCSNLMIALLRNLIPSEVRMPCFVVIIATFVTMVEIVFKAYLSPELNAALGIFIPLIVVNCIIMHRAESFASRYSVARSVMDGLGSGIGFTLAVCLIAAIREPLGSGSLWGYPWMPKSWPIEYVPASILIQAPGGFLVLGLVLGFFAWRQKRKAAAPACHSDNAGG